MNNEIEKIIYETQKVIIGKTEVLEKVMMSILAKGHILLDDVPGVGKTTMAVALSKTIGLKYNRIQFTPDVLPSDIVGFSIYNKNAETFQYMPGIVTNTNILLGDEINRTSSKTQSALLEAMEENQVTVDGNSHPLLNPFIVIATQNQIGTAGTQILPQAQIDRFLIRLTIGYPDDKSQMEIIRDRQKINPIDHVEQVSSIENILKMQKETLDVTMKDSIISYITELTVASRNNPMIELGISPRGALFISRMAKARAYVEGRDFVVPEDVQYVYTDVCAHRIILGQKAKVNRVEPEEVLQNILKNVKVPFGLK